MPVFIEPRSGGLGDGVIETQFIRMSQYY